MLYFVEKDLDEEGREKFRKSLEQVIIPKPKKRHLKVVPDKSGAIAVENPKKWRAPDGWTPPGWNPDKSFQNAKQFMGFNASMKGKK